MAGAKAKDGKPGSGRRPELLPNGERKNPKRKRREKSEVGTRGRAVPKAPPAAPVGHSVGAGNSTAERLVREINIPEREPVEDDLEGELGNGHVRKHKERKLPQHVRDQIERVKRNLQVHLTLKCTWPLTLPNTLLGHRQDRP